MCKVLLVNSRFICYKLHWKYLLGQHLLAREALAFLLYCEVDDVGGAPRSHAGSKLRWLGVAARRYASPKGAGAHRQDARHPAFFIADYLFDAQIRVWVVLLRHVLHTPK